MWLLTLGRANARHRRAKRKSFPSDSVVPFPPFIAAAHSPRVGPFDDETIMDNLKKSANLFRAKVLFAVPHRRSVNDDADQLYWRTNLSGVRRRSSSGWVAYRFPFALFSPFLAQSPHRESRASRTLSCRVTITRRSILDKSRTAVERRDYERSGRTVGLHLLHLFFPLPSLPTAATGAKDGTEWTGLKVYVTLAGNERPSLSPQFLSHRHPRRG